MKKFYIIFGLLLSLSLGIGVTFLLKTIEDPVSLHKFRDIKPSSEPEAGCKWSPFRADTIGIFMLIQDCVPSVVGGYAVVGNAIIDIIPDTGLLADYKDIEVFNKPKDQKIEDAIKEQFLDRIPNNKCVVVRYVEDYKNRNTFAERYLIQPNPRRKALLDKEAGTDIPNYDECGEYALDPDAERYFEYQPNTSQTKFMFVSLPPDLPYFDPESIRIY
jgi:hypothetical protein